MSTAKLKKQMDIEEFVEFGYLQEANRRFFHPLGLELKVDMGEVGYDITYDKTVERLPSLDFVWDRRNSAKVLLSKVDPEKAERVAGEMKKRRSARRALRECNSNGLQKVPKEK